MIRGFVLGAATFSCTIVLSEGCNQLLEHQDRERECQISGGQISGDRQTELSETDSVRSCQRHSSCLNDDSVQVSYDCDGLQCTGQAQACDVNGTCQNTGSNTVGCCYTNLKQLQEQQCTSYAGCPGGVVVDLSNYSQNGFWGPANARGGTTFYAGEGEPHFTLTRRQRDQDHPNPRLNVAFSIEKGNGFIGIVFGFNGYCVDASQYQGIKVDVTNKSKGVAALRLLVQTNGAYPIEPEHGKGACHYSSCPRKWSDCTFCGSDFPTSSATNEADDSQTFELSKLTNQQGMGCADYNDIVAIALQVKCDQTAPCQGSFDLGNITLTQPRSVDAECASAAGSTQ